MIAINGFGRIGRSLLRIAFERNIKIVAINDIHNIETLAYLFKYDSIYGRFPGKVEVKKNYLEINGKKIYVFNEKDPLKLPWKDLGVEYVIESTGIFKDKFGASLHLKAGAKKVFITTPSVDSDITIVPGVNQDKLKKEHNIISVASCTTNALTPILKILNDNFGIVKAMMTTAHAYTNDQIIHDSGHKKIRRGRAANLNIIPTFTGASEAVEAVLPELKGKVDGIALRVPVACGSLIDLTAELKKDFDIGKINQVFEKESKGKFKGILEYSEDELVSSDVIGNSNSVVIDGLSTMKKENLVKVLGWYDNEYGYSNRVFDVINLLKKR